MSALVDAPTKTTKILITGGTGWLAQHLFSALTKSSLFKDNIKIHLTYRNDIPHWNVPERCHYVDFKEVSNQDWEELLTVIMPDIIVHTAAISSPVACEVDQPSATKINVTSPSALVEAVKKCTPHCIFINCSTDLVYGGPDAGTMWEEKLSVPFEAQQVLPQPSTVYGRTKYAFEGVVSQLPFGVSLRLSNMIGPVYCYREDGPPKFLQWLRTSISERAFVTLKNDEKRSFVSVFDVIAVIERYVEVAVMAHARLALGLGVKLAEHYASSHCFSRAHASRSASTRIMDGGTHGSTRSSMIGGGGSVYNVGGPEGLSRFDMAVLVAESMGVEVEVLDSEPVRRHNSSPSPSSSWQVASMSCEKIDGKNHPKARAPRNATMHSHDTCAALGVRFMSMEELLQSDLCE